MKACGSESGIIPARRQSQLRLMLVMAVTVISVTLMASQRPPVFREQGYGLRDLAPPTRSQTMARPDVVLAEPAALPVAEAGRSPVVGMVRSLVAVSYDRLAPTSFESKGAVRIRLRLDGVSLTPGMVGWVLGANGEAVPFGPELLFEDSLWTPSVAGDSISLVLPEGARANVSAIGHISRTISPTATECIQDVSCNTFPDRETLTKAVAAYLFVDDSSGLINACTGALINGAEGDRLFLTSRSCVASASEAASVEAAWDFRTPFCGGNVNPATITTGATLLATSASTDAALLRMNALPPGRWLMGWSTGTLAAGEALYRISHPALADNSGLFAQAFALTSLTTASGSCPIFPRPNFLHSNRVTGGVGPPSLGAPVIRTGGLIVGQLYAICSASGPPDGCSSSSVVIDGALSVAYNDLKAFIDPPTPAGCVANATTACVLSNRFRVSIAYVNPFSNPPNQPGNFLGARLLQGTQNPDVALFGFNSAQAVEVVVRIQDARPFANRFDVYYGGLTDVGYTVTVTDTQTGTTRQYVNNVGTVGGGVDRNSFPAN